MTMQTSFIDADGVEIRVETNGAQQVRLIIIDPEVPDDSTMFDFADDNELHAFIVDLLTADR